MRIAATILALTVTTTAQSPQPRLDELLAEPALDGARIGVIVRDLDSGDVLCEHDADKGFMTASNMKLVTVATALVTLGPEFRFKTTLIGTSPVHDGVLDGDLVLVGSGDPSFGGRQEGGRPEAVFERMIDELVAKHRLKRITGSVLGDDDCQPDEVMGEGWAWGYQSASYAAQVSGLCFNENCASVVLAATAPGSAPRVEVRPAAASGFVSVVNAAVTTEPGAKTRTWAERERATNRVHVGGALAADAAGARESFSIENPTAFAAVVRRDTLVRSGIAVDGPALDRDDLPRPERYGDEVVLATHESPPASELLTTLNKVSQNLYAEQLIRAASRHALGRGGMEAAAAHAKQTLKGLGVDVRGMRVADGSGLTRLNLVRPSQLAQLLAGMWNGAHHHAWLATMPIAGVDGTLEERFKDLPNATRVRAKTGYISSVVALSGYVLREDERPPIVFSILVNNFTCPTAATKAAVDRFVASLLD